MIQAHCCHLHSKNTNAKHLKQIGSFVEVKKKFETFPKHTQKTDISRKASERNLYSQPNKYWLQNSTKHGDVLSIDTSDEFGMFNTVKLGVETWIDQINSRQKLKKDLKDQLMDNFHSLKITDARKLIKKIKNKTFLKYLSSQSNAKTHPHLNKAARIQLIRLE